MTNYKRKGFKVMTFEEFASQEGRQWTEEACQARLLTCTKKRNWRHRICGEFITFVMEIESQDGISRSWR